MNTTDLELVYESMSRVLFLARGIPSSGKSTTVKKLVPDNLIFSADKYFERDGSYKFDRTQLGTAHNTCYKGAEAAMQRDESRIAVDNTNTTVRECKTYIDLAKKYGYEIKIVESSRPEWMKTALLLNDKVKYAKELDTMADFFAEDNKKTHNVPKEAILAMFQRWVPSSEIQKLI